MPIKFACPTCKNVLQVSSKLAGKKGKCKCGAQITIPTPKPAASAAAPAPAQPAASSKMFDELTDGDFGREDPHTELYTGKKTNNDASSLSRFTDQIQQEKAKEVGQARGLMIVAAVLNFLSAIMFGAIAAFLILANSWIDKVAEVLPIVSTGKAFGLAWSISLTILLIAGGVGGIMRTAWGWFLMAMLYVYFVVDRIVGIGMLFTEEFDQGSFFSAMVSTLAVVSLTMFIFRDTTREMCGIKTKLPMILAAVLGLIGAGAVNGTMYALLSEAEKQAEAADIDDTFGETEGEY